MAKVYIVSRGEYSDWSIEGIFSTREAAMAAIKDMGNDRDAYGSVNDEPDEYELDEKVGYEVGPVFEHRIRLESGASQAAVSRPKYRHPSRVEVDMLNLPPGPGIRVLSPISAEHAAKVAAEERQRWLRENATVHHGSSS